MGWILQLVSGGVGAAIVAAVMYTRLQRLELDNEELERRLWEVERKPYAERLASIEATLSHLVHAVDKIQRALEK
jgi:hypothetical protein